MRLSENEKQIMQLMWDGKPLSREEILKGTKNRTWNPASVHLILNSLLSKGAIRVTDETKKYGRTYEAAISKEEYAREYINDLRELFSGMTQDEFRKMLLETA